MAKPSLSGSEEALLQEHSHGIGRLLVKGHVPVNFRESFAYAALPILVFVLVLVPLLLPWWPWLPLQVACWLAAAAIVFFLALQFGVTLLSSGERKDRMLNRSALFWGWWPFWSFVLCFVAAGLSLSLGHRLWQGHLSRYYELQTLQLYYDINPWYVSGERIQDSGLVNFSVFSDLDRSAGGCFVDEGTTYCVAPIVQGRVAGSIGSAPSTGSYDMFAVGKDCCTCPNMDFRCGDWQNPQADGGIRSLDFAARPFYRLAVESWAAAYGKVASHPVFFEWVQDPLAQWHQMWTWCVNLCALAFIGWVTLMVTVCLILGKVLRILVNHDFATPTGSLEPPGLGRAWGAIVPHLHKRHADTIRQWNTALPLPYGGYGTLLAQMQWTAVDTP